MAARHWHIIERKSGYFSTTALLSGPIYSKNGRDGANQEARRVATRRAKETGRTLHRIGWGYFSLFDSKQVPSMTIVQKRDCGQDHSIREGLDL